ncbi:flippase-like domain-containing protein [bacterium]|nr:flippase-like domain-containing protein [bacterium]MBU1984722.1 flippase-like domain-containing protein [bacterium]
MRVARLAIGFGLGLLFLYLTFFVPHFGTWFDGETGIAEAFFGHARFDLSQLGRVIASADWTPIAWAGVLFFVSLVVRAWRWQIMLEPLVRMRFGDVFSAMCIGYMANNVLPLRIGEVYRAHVVYRLSGLSRSAAFGSIILERVTDSFFMLPFMGLAFVLYPLPGAMHRPALLIGIAAFAASAFLVWLAVDRSRAMRWIERVFAVLPSKAAAACTTMADRFSSGFASLGTWRRIIPIVTTSLALWAMYAGMVYCVLLSLGFMNADLPALDRNPMGATLVILIITTLGFVIPGAPGAVGTYHGVAVLGLSLFGVPGDRAAGFAILLHALNYFPLTVLGLIYFWRLGLTFRQTREMTENVHGASDAVPD